MKELRENMIHKSHLEILYVKMAFDVGLQKELEFSRQKSGQEDQVHQRERDK